MKTTRERFVEHYGVLYAKELLEKLPPEEITTKMIHEAGVIINHLNSHLISAIHSSLKKGDDDVTR